MNTQPNLDDAFQAFEREAAALDAVLAEVEAEQAKGRSGYESYLRAQAQMENVKTLSLALGRRIEEARRAL